MKAKIGVMSEELVRGMFLSVAKGTFKIDADVPKVWYSSLNALAQVLRPENIELLNIIETEKPESMTELAELTGRARSNLSATMKKLSDKGFARVEKQGHNISKPIAIFTEFEIVAGRELEDRVKTAMTAADLQLPATYAERKYAA